MIKKIDMIGEIGVDINALDFINELKAAEQCNDTIELQISCVGGEVISASAIINYILNSHYIYRCKIIGLAAGVGSQIASVCDRVRIVKNGYFHLSMPFVVLDQSGYTNSIIEILERITVNAIKCYGRHTDLSESEIREMMEGGAMLDAETAKAKGFCHGICEV